MNFLQAFTVVYMVPNQKLCDCSTDKDDCLLRAQAECHVSAPQICSHTCSSMLNWAGWYVTELEGNIAHNRMVPRGKQDGTKRR